MVSPAAVMSHACKKLRRPSGPMGTSVRAVSGISNNWRFSTSPGPRVRRCCHAASLVGAGTERERLVPPSGARTALARDSLSAAGRRQAPGATRRRQAIQRRKQLLFIVEIQVRSNDSSRRRSVGIAPGTEIPVITGLRTQSLSRCSPARPAEAILACGYSRSNAELYGQPLGDNFGLRGSEDGARLDIAICRMPVVRWLS